MKNIISKNNSINEFIRYAQIQWELLKYEYRKFTIDYSKTVAIIRKENNGGLI